MKRWVINVVAGILLVISIGMCALWVRSYYEFDALRWQKRLGGEGHDHVGMAEVYSGKGAVEFDWQTYHFFPSRPGGRRLFWMHADYLRRPQDRGMWAGWRKSFAGFGVTNDWVDEKTRKSMDWSIADIKQNFAPPKTPPATGGWRWIESFRSVWVPHWFLVLVFGVMPGRRIYVGVRKRRRMARGWCLSCGYDLRGSGERCPECGEVAQKSTGKMPVGPG